LSGDRYILDLSEIVSLAAVFLILPG